MRYIIEGYKELNNNNIIHRDIKPENIIFDEAGNPVFNDPGRNVVRMTYDRAAFDRAWASSGRAVYVVYPDSWPIPATSGPWPRNGR